MLESCWPYRRILGVCWNDKISKKTIREKVQRHCTVVDLIRRRKTEALSSHLQNGWQLTDQVCCCFAGDGGRQKAFGDVNKTPGQKDQDTNPHDQDRYQDTKSQDQDKTKATRRQHLCYFSGRVQKIHVLQFLTCVSHTAHVIDIVYPSFCPSVRHTLQLCRNGSTYRQTVFTAW